MPSSSEHPRSVQAVGQRSHGSHLCGKFNFVPCRVLAARLLAQRVKRKDLAGSLEGVWTRVGLRSWVFEFLLGFRAAEKTISAVHEPELAEARLSGVWVQLLGVCSGYSL